MNKDSGAESMTKGRNSKGLGCRKGGFLSAAFAVPLLLGACSLVADEEPGPAGLSAEAQPAENETYPNLGTVPSERPTVTSAEQREALRESLQEQRSDSLPTMRDGQANDGYSGGQLPPVPDPSPEAAPDPTTNQSSGLAPSQSLAQTASAPAASDGVYYQPPQQQLRPGTRQYAQSTYDNAGMLLAGETPPGMVEPMAYNQGGHAMGTTIISSNGVVQPSPQAGGGFLPSSQSAVADPAAAYAGMDNLAGVIYFQHGSYGLDGTDRRILREVADAQKARGRTVVVVGHASSRTQNLAPERHFEANLAMSQRRAKAVAEALRGYGVAAGSLSVEARGAAQPVFKEVMPSGEAGNRRVEIYLR